LTGKIHQTNEAYAIAKIAGIQLCKAIYNQYGLDVVALMPTNIYGINDKYDDQKSHVIPAMILKFLKAKKYNKKIVKIWGDGTPKREFLYSDDLAEAIRIVLNTSNKRILKLCQNKFPIINIGSKDIYSIKKLANLIKNKVGFNGNIFFDNRYPNGVAKKNLNYDKIKTLNWKPKINLSKGLDIILKHEKINL